MTNMKHPLSLFSHKEIIISFEDQMFLVKYCIYSCYHFLEGEALYWWNETKVYRLTNGLDQIFLDKWLNKTRNKNDAKYLFQNKLLEQNLKIKDANEALDYCKF